MDSRIRYSFIMVLLLLAGCRVTGRGGPTSPPAPLAEGAAARLTRERDNVQHGVDETALVRVLSSVGVHDGELIRVTEGGEGRLDFGEALILRLFNDSLLQTINTAPAPGASGAAYVFSLQQGGLSGQLAEAGETAVIETPGGATITILGTQFFVVYNASTGETTVGNFDGAVEIDDGSGTFPLDARRQVTLPGRIQQPLPVTFAEFEQLARAGGPVAAAQSLQPGPPPTPTPPPPRALPDLAIADFIVVGEPRVETLPGPISSRLAIRVPVRLTVINRGARPAPIFHSAIMTWPENHGSALCLAVDGNADACYPATDGPLPAGASHTFEGLLDFPLELAGNPLQLAAAADVCVFDVDLPAYCRVQESDEANNHSPAVSVELPMPVDLVITEMTLTGGVARTQDGASFAVPVAVTVENVGGAPAGPFKVSTEAITPDGQFLFPFSVRDQESTWYPFTRAPLGPMESVTLQGAVIIPIRYAGATVRLLALADSCAAEEFAAPECRILEWDEFNNWSVELPVRLPSIVD
jgi:hypothetical protein